MGMKEGDPYPCVGNEYSGVVIALDANGDPVSDNGLVASACFADWYYGVDKWVWRRDTDPANPPVDPDPPQSIQP